MASWHYLAAMLLWLHCQRTLAVPATSSELLATVSLPPVTPPPVNPTTKSAVKPLSPIRTSSPLASSETFSKMPKPGTNSDYVAATFSVRSDRPLRHLVVDRRSGKVIVGATNAVFQLSPDLVLGNERVTGPKLDSPQCFSDSCQEHEKKATDNHNKVLLVDYDHDKVIACGSVYQGACQRLSATNISQSEELIRVAVAANDDRSSTVAFIGPQRYLMANEARVLYVGVTFNKNGPYRDLVPAIASRHLQTFDLAEKGFSNNPKVEIESNLRDYFRVRYLYGFQAGEHAYFVTVQRKSHLQSNEEEGYVTRLARVCISDSTYNTYTEVTVQCLGSAPSASGPSSSSSSSAASSTSDVLVYNVAETVTLVEAGAELAEALRVSLGDLVLVGAFARSVNHTADTWPHAALCAFTMTDVEHKFSENIHLCLNGSVQSRSMDYVAGNQGHCPAAGESGNIYNFCDASLKISGTVPLKSMAAAIFPNTTATAMAANVVDPHTVVFMATKNGSVKKILLQGASTATEYEDVPVDPGRPILSDMAFDVSGDTLYLMTSLKVMRLKVENCLRYSSCSACIGAKDPYCGWCSLERRCTVKSTCQNASRHEVSASPPRWLSLGSQCIDFQEVRPNMVTITDIKMVELTIHELPSGPKYLCVFGGSPPTEATFTATGLRCLSPAPSTRPKILPGQDHVVVPLAVRSSETNTDFVSRDFIFFDCSKHTTCKSCTNSRWSCSWCIYENFCTTNASSCRKAVASAIYTNPALGGPGGPKGPRSRGPASQCPRFGNTANILIPHEVEKEIEVPVLDLPMPQQGHEGFHCILEIEGAKAEVKARIEGDKVICEQRMYTYQLQVGELKVNLTVVWNGDHHIDTTEVILYKCRILGSHHLRDDCSLCTIQHRKYGCGWCNNACSYRLSCPSPPSDACPEPRIDVIRPLSAPIEGGTLVTIEGGNLGSRVEDVRRNVTIGDIPCELVDYNVSVRIVCRAGPSPSGEINAALKVGNRRNYTVSTEKFSYKNVSVFDVSPNVGPVAGGTTLTIRGNNLNVGSFLNVTLDGLPCRIDRYVTSSGQITCRTSRSPSGPQAVSQLIVVLDGATRIIHKPFTYVEDPTVFRIYPTETFASGGRRITVEGTNFLSVQNPKMVVFERNQSISESVCQVVNNSVMDCPSPPVDMSALGQSDDRDAPKIRGKRWRLRRATNSASSSSPTIRLRVGFIMDEVTTVTNLTKNFPHVTSELVYVNDPMFFPFAKNRVKLYKGDTLVIEGENLKLASDERDVNVTIGMKPCNVTSLAMAQLVCTPPNDQPRGTDELGNPTDNNLPSVVVRVGHNLRFPIGYLRYEVIKTYEFPEEAIGGISAGGAFLIVLSVIILIIYRRKSTQAEREYKRIQIQMDTLESNVRSECKQAFAELQTDMTDLTSDLEATGIPSLDHPTYVMKVFFPGVSDHPILSDPKMRCGIVRSNYDAAMLQFEQLLSNKNFLLAFIETLENQKSFSIRDKVSVASLLMVILMNKMEYATDVLKSLLLRLIDKSVCTKHPQLMLRRTESVVEKMLTNWMALCMYNYLKDYAGSSLFLLVKAIAHQVEKGPVDNVTHDARYSLSEERLLREPIQHSFVTIQVIQEDLDEKAQCKVLDCDTIGQVKSKILDALHKNTPYSIRPSIDEVDLEWRHGRGGHLTLQDEDLTTKTINGWKQLNTLAHYGVKESAVMSLIAKQNESFNSNCKQPCSNCTGNYSLNSVSPFVSVNGDIEHGVKVYHLVKSVDDHQYHSNNKERIHKAIPEIFLTRLLSTKGTVQKFVDDFFSTVLTANEALPPAIKWLFDTFDEGARRHGITDPEVVHAWKSNSLPLRFWVNFIKNPDFVFDIHKTPTVDACLSVIAQTFMDSCSTSEHRLGKDSPSNKLLFAKDIPHYKDMVTRFYVDIQQMPQITDQEMNSAMQQLSMAHMGEFDTVTALKELYIYATKYDEYILEALETDPHCKRLHLAHKLENVACTLDGEETSTC